ncbi:thiol-disulfide oxidoreductase DCC family protein [Primorskyibacter sp. 2E107]|uniref:thiol-disulfide oxidoreductase DCC family protein n=1 Tax=Primorskyibacter sp. 2E107 TaxID=3403458 RepID=UPI003AF74D15
MTQLDENASPRTRTLYNADCPVCNAEICHYADYAEGQALPLAFDDLNTADLAHWGVTEDQAARLLHVSHDGKLYAGFDAFLILWEQMPRYRWMARIGGLPVIRPLADAAYTHVLARIIYNRHLRRQAARRKQGQAQG